jgi:hypothetical protein
MNSSLTRRPSEDKFPVVFIAQSNGLAQSMERLAQREHEAAR